MKKYLIAAAMMVIIAACGNDANNSSEKAGDDNAAVDNTDTEVGDITANPDYQKGLDLIGQSDCLTCHKVSEKLVGPAYQEVADKYAGQDTAVDYLAGKIINGGAGVWGQIPMTPHKQLSEDDAKQMVKYILLLKTK